MVEPVRPVRRAEPFDHPDWLFEPKHDGFRALAYLSCDGCSLRSRNNKVFHRFEALGAAVRDELTIRSAILDGEVVAVDESGHLSFELLMRRGGRLAYLVFDILWRNGRDLRPLPLMQRKRLLDAAMSDNTLSVMKVLTVEGDGVALFRAVQSLDLEGIVAKARKADYGPRTVWEKVLNPAYSQKRGRSEWFHPQRG
jgi:bifunctional non-homologous end joining protein LigD